MEKTEWIRPTVTDFDIAERTQQGGAARNDGLDPGTESGGGDNGS